MKINMLIFENIYNYMKFNKMDVTKIELIKNGAAPYRATGDISDIKRNKFNDFLLKQPTLSNKFDLLIKNKFGTVAEMDRQLGKRGTKDKLLRWIKNSKELLDIIDCEVNIKLK